MQQAGAADLVVTGYLNYSEPPFRTAVETCLDQGASEILVVPYFLVPGRFVTADLPRAVEDVRALYPDMPIQIADCIGFDERLADAILDCADSAEPPVSWNAALSRASAACRPDPGCPLYETRFCPLHPGDREIEAE